MKLDCLFDLVVVALLVGTWYSCQRGHGFDGINRLPFILAGLFLWPLQVQIQIFQQSYLHVCFTQVNGKAPTRAYHSATLYRHELWIFGGVYPRPDPQPDGCSNDIHIFSPVMESWYNPIVSGEKPIPRSGWDLLMQRLYRFTTIEKRHICNIYAYFFWQPCLTDLYMKHWHFKRLLKSQWTFLCLKWKRINHSDVFSQSIIY